MGVYVQIVESPSPADLADGRTEGGSLRETFRLSGTKHDYRLAVNREQFERVFNLNDPDGPIARNLHNGDAPILHLSMHGNEEGIGLTDGTFLDWETLRDILTPVNDALPQGLLVAFSTCGGAASIRMSMRVGADDRPFFATIGVPDDVHWADALIAFTAFYHNLLRHNLTVEECVRAMQVASGNASFMVFSGEQQKAKYIDYVKQRLRNERQIETQS